MPAASNPGDAIVAALKAALKAAKAYKPRNMGDGDEANLIIGLLGDCLVHAAVMEELATTRDQSDRVAKARDELRAAEAGITPDTLLKP